MADEKDVLEVEEAVVETEEEVKEEEVPEEVSEEEPFIPFNTKEEEKVEVKGEELDEEDQAAIDSRVDAKTQKLATDVTEVKMKQDISDFLNQEGNEVYKPVADQIKEFAQHPKAKGMSMEAIARMAVDPRDLIAQGAKKEREATEESKEGVTAGSSGRPTPDGDTLPNAFDLSKDEFERKASSIG